MSSKRDAAVTDSTGITPLVKRDALLFTDHTKMGHCDRFDAPLKRIPPQSQLW
jgi:hypothetical protein